MSAPAEEPLPTAAAATPAESSERRLTWVKEITTAFLAVAIVTVTLWLLASTFFSVETRTVTAADVQDPALGAAVQLAHQQAFEQRQTVLAIAIGLVGVVTGYFFGRVPVERRAQVAEQNAATQAAAAEAAASSRDEAVQAANGMRGKLADVRATVNRMTAPPTAAMTAGAPVDVELTALKERMGW